MPRTLDQIRERGLDALKRELGRAGMIRFLQQFESGRGDYAKERRAWVDKMSLDDLLKLMLSKKAGVESKAKPAAAPKRRKRSKS
jgi:hypothetical protein